MIKTPGQFDRSEPDLLKGGVYLGGGAYATKVGVDSGLTRLLGARLERHSTSKEAAKKIIDRGGFLDVGQGVRKSMTLLENPPVGFESTFAERLKKSEGKNFISGYHPAAKQRSIFGYETRLENNPFRNAWYRRIQAFNYRIQAEIDFDRVKDRQEVIKQVVKNSWGGVIGTKGKTLFAPVTDRQVLKSFRPDIDDPIALMTKKKVRVYNSRMGALLGHLKKHGLSQVKANPSRVAAGAAILGTAGAIGANLSRKGWVEVEGYIRDGRKVKGYKRQN